MQLRKAARRSGFSKCLESSYLVIGRRLSKRNVVHRAAGCSALIADWLLCSSDDAQDIHHGRGQFFHPHSRDGERFIFDALVCDDARNDL